MIGEDARREGFQEADAPHHPLSARAAPDGVKVLVAQVSEGELRVSDKLGENRVNCPIECKV